ncbi:MAG: tetratricopeptide repeat protein [Ignavibacteriales bacterium]|nr:tetratricopeptide repeat protein [Ignavibacteriales bacterium]
MSFQIIITILVAVGSLAFFIPTPQELRESFVAGQNYFAARNYQKAIEQYDKILETESDLLTADSVRVVLLNGELNVGVRSAAVYQKANSYRTLGMLDSAISVFRTMLDRSDSPKLTVLSRYQIYDLFLQKKEYDSAIVSVRDLIRAHPFDEKVEQALYDLGWAFRFKQEYDSSSIAFRFLADRYKQSPFRVRALYQIGQNDLDAQRWKDAVNAFTYLLSEYKPESFTSSDFENMELRVNRERQIFDAVSNREADNTNLELASKSEFKIAEAYERLNNIDSAVARYQYIIRTYTLLPSLIEISYVRWAELLQKVKGTENAIQVYRRAIDEHFQNKVFQARMQYKIARTYQDQKEFSRSAEEYAFYIKAYAEFADQADFSLENARFFSVLNFSAAKHHEQAIVSADSFLVNHAGSEFTPKALIMRGNAYLSLRHFEEARASYQQVMDEYSSSEEFIHARMQFPRSFYDGKRYEEAISYYRNLEFELQSGNELSEVQYYLGMSYFFLGNLDESIASLKNVESSSQFYPFSFARIVKIFASQSKLDTAEAFIIDVIAQLPDSSEFKPYAHLSYGELLAISGKFEKAIGEMTIVIQDSSVVENARLQARYARGALYQQTKKFNEAIDDLEFCLREQAFRNNFAMTIPTANEKLALSYLGIGKRKEATEKILNLLEGATSKVERVKYLSALTELYVQLNDFPKIIEFGNRVVAADSADDHSRAKAYGALANAYGNANNLEKVVSVLRQAADTLPHHPFIKDLVWQMANLMFDGQAFAFADPLFEKYIERYPADERCETALYNRGISLFGINKVDDAVKLKRQYIAQYPQSIRLPKVQYEIAEIYYNAERFDMATQEYDRTVKMFPSSEFAATAQYNKGWCYYRLGDTLKMVESFERFVQSHPHTPQAPDAQFSIGDYYYNIKEYEKAKQAYRVILDKYPAYVRVEEAKNLVRELDQINSFTEYSKAMTYFDTQDFLRAIPLLEEVLKKYPDADVRYACEANIASAYSELGEKKKALEMFSKIIEKYSGTAEAQMVVFFAEQHKRWLETSKNQ